MIIKKEKVLNVLSIITITLFSLLILVPLIYLSFYTNPNAEDFSLSISPKHVSVFYYMRGFYLGFDGRYSTNFLFYFNPLSFNLIGAYKLMPLFFISSFFFSVYFLLVQIFRTLFVKKVETYKTILLAIFLISIFFNRVYSLPHILYWEASAFVFFLPLVFYNFFLCFFISLLKAQTLPRKQVFFFASALFLFLGIGLNEMCLPLYHLSFIIMLGWFLFNKKSIPYSVTSLYIILIFSTVLFVSAPGILSRSQGFSHERYEIFFIDYLVHFTTHHFVFFKSSLFSIFAMLLFSKLLIQNNLSKLDFTKKFYLLFAITLVMCVLIISLTYYIPMGHDSFFPKRIFNFLLWIIILGFATIFPIRISSDGFKGYLMFFIGLFLICSMTLNKEYNFSRAVCLIQTGEHIKFNNEYQKRFKILQERKDSNVQELCLDSFRHQNTFNWYYPDIKNDRQEEYWNQAYENYFNIPRILLEGDEKCK